MTFAEMWPGVAIVALIVGWATVSTRQRKRFAEAVKVVVEALRGRHEPGGYLSGGTIYGSLDGRDIVITFDHGSSSRLPRTTVIALMKPRRRERVGVGNADVVLRRKLTGGWEGVRYSEALMRRLEAAGVSRVTAGSTMLTAAVPRIVRDGRRLVELASIVAAAADAERR